ncbi:MAG: alkaline ceramidase, partial [Ruthenibacterium sp.]
FTLYTFNAEVSQYYAAYARCLVPGAVCAGYTNGMIGYVSTAEQIEQGGYEPCDSALYFALAGRYSAKIEALIHGALNTL